MFDAQRVGFPFKVLSEREFYGNDVGNQLLHFALFMLAEPNKGNLEPWMQLARSLSSTAAYNQRAESALLSSLPFKAVDLQVQLAQLRFITTWLRCDLRYSLNSTEKRLIVAGWMLSLILSTPTMS